MRSAGNGGLGKDAEPRALTSWRFAAMCQYVDPEMFFPDQSKGSLGSRQAKAVCRLCPVTVQCLAFAESNGIEHGVWGGQSTTDRAVNRVKTCQRGHEIAGDNAEACVVRGKRYMRCRQCKSDKDRESTVRKRKCPHRPFEAGNPCRDCSVEAGLLGASRRWLKEVV